LYNSPIATGSPDHDNRGLMMFTENDNLTIDHCPIIHFPKIANRAGNITPLQNQSDLPFEIARVFYIYDIPGGESRGAHAHKTCHQMIVAISGSFEVEMNDGTNTKNSSVETGPGSVCTFLPVFGLLKKGFRPVRCALF
jgi:hypothetical protein